MWVKCAAPEIGVGVEGELALGGGGFDVEHGAGGEEEGREGGGGCVWEEGAEGETDGAGMGGEGETVFEGDWKLWLLVWVLGCLR